MPPLLLLLAAAAAPVGSGAPADVRFLLANGSPSQAVAILTASGGWGAFLSRVAGGDADAIALVPALSRGASSDGATDLAGAMAEALPRNPSAVLARLDPERGAPMSAATVCGGGALRLDGDGMAGWMRAARGAVDGVYREDASLMAPGEDCIAAIDALGPTP